MAPASASTSIDLASVVVSPHTTVDVLHPLKGQPCGIRVKVASLDSPEVRAVEREQHARRLQRVSAGAPTKLSLDELEADGLELLVRATMGWEGVVENGATVECTPDNVRRVYTAHPWLRRQVDAALADRSRFIKA